MSLSYPPLFLEDDGRVYVEPASEHARPECLGYIDEGCDYPELEIAWSWLAREWEDGKRFAAGCRAAAESAYLGAIGDPCSRARFY